MSRTFIRQDTQIRKSDAYTDTTTPSQANYETNAVNIEDDLNSLRSVANNLINRNGASFPAGDWYTDLTAPLTFESGIARGVNKLNLELHELERKRVLTTQEVHTVDITVPGGLTPQNYVVLAIGELPYATPVAAVGNVATLGIVSAYSAGFGAHALDAVSGASPISPKNLCEVIAYDTHDPILSDNRVVYALFQVETNVDGDVINGTTNRAQLSFVRLNLAGTALEAVPTADIAGKVIHYAAVQRKALEDLNEQDFLRGASNDVPGSTLVSRQIAYNNQAATPVELTTNATLDLNAAGITWALRDLVDGSLFSVTEGSTGGTSTVALGADVDTFDVNAVVNDFSAGLKANTSGTEIDVGVTAGSINTTGSADLTVKGAGELYLNDGNQTGSTWTQVGIKLSDTTGEWDAFETNFGEVSILNALNQAYDRSRSPKVYTDILAPVSANTDVDVGTNMTYGTFGSSYDVYLNGNLLRPGADASANNDYYPGTAATEIKFEFQLKAGDVLCVVPYANA